MGLYWEDLAPGWAGSGGERLVAPGDIEVFGALTGDSSPLHFSDAAARAAGFDGAVAHGALGLSLALGIISRMGLTRGTLIALVELKWRYRVPVRAGDTISARVVVRSRTATSRPDRGLVTLAVEVTNQDAIVVQEGEIVELVRRREPAAAPTSPTVLSESP